MSDEPSKEALEASRELMPLVYTDYCVRDSARIIDKAFTARCKDCQTVNRLREAVETGLAIFGTALEWEDISFVLRRTLMDGQDVLDKALAETGEGETP